MVRACFLLFILILACNSPYKDKANDLQGLVNEYSALDSTGQVKNDSRLALMQKAVKDSIGGFKLEIGAVKYLVFVADLDKHDINLHLYNPEDGKNFSNIARLKNHVEKQKQEPLMITNAGMFTPEHTPEGLYLSQADSSRFETDTLNPYNNLNFYLMPNGVFYIDSVNTPHIVKTEDYRADKVKMATQSGPMLVIDGKLHPAFKSGATSKHIRSGVGIINNKKVVFACTTDKSNFYDFASAFRNIFGCNDALFLDGAISLMYIKGISDNTLGGDFGPMISVTKNDK